MVERDAEKETTQDELREVTIGALVPLNARIVLSEYDPQWPVLYEREAARLRSVFGAEPEVLEHVGSTSVVGLPAKPIIDMVLAVPDSSDEATYVPKLEGVGYVLRIREPNWHEHRVFKGPDTDINLHVFSVGCSEIEKMLRFRDWLRKSQVDRERYAASKRELACPRWKFVQNYADAKSSIVQQILASSLAGGTGNARINR